MTSLSSNDNIRQIMFPTSHVSFPVARKIIPMHNQDATSDKTDDDKFRFQTSYPITFLQQEVVDDKKTTNEPKPSTAAGNCFFIITYYGI
jgi:hypothetical protein